MPANKILPGFGQETRRIGGVCQSEKYTANPYRRRYTASSRDERFPGHGTSKACYSQNGKEGVSRA